MTIAAVALCKNEEKDLPAFLANCNEWADEIILVDDGSTDGSREIAEAHASVRFISHPMGQTGFAGQRNVGIESAVSDWILHLDVDERLGPELFKEMQEAVKQSNRNAFRYRRINFFLHREMKGGGWVGWNRPQLARRGFHHFEGSIHEQCVVEGGDEAIGQLGGSIWHLNDEGYEERMRKSVQYATAEAHRLMDSGRRVTAWGMCWQACRSFMVKYIYKRGFLDGMPGFISALHGADATFRAHALAWDLQNRIDRKTLENEMQKRWENAHER